MGHLLLRTASAHSYLVCGFSNAVAIANSMILFGQHLVMFRLRKDRPCTVRIETERKM